jgi:hypothetical protein
VQSVKVQVYVFVPEQTGSGPAMGPATVSRPPQELTGLGGTGITWAAAMQATVDEPAAGSVKVGGLMVYV